MNEIFTMRQPLSSTLSTAGVTTGAPVSIYNVHRALGGLRCALTPLQALPRALGHYSTSTFGTFQTAILAPRLIGEFVLQSIQARMPKQASRR